MEIIFNKRLGPSVASSIRKLGGHMKHANGVDSVILPAGMTREAFAAALDKEIALLPKGVGEISARDFRDFDIAVRDILDQVFGPDENARPGETELQRAFRTNGHEGLPVRR